MAICANCGRRYDPAEAEEEYDNDSFIRNHDLEGTYGGTIDLCAECAVEDTMDGYGFDIDD